mmetsp:Transcript_71890/g.120555  ORF Transcript_71890/g.120555 Transcript_71890/m.120555 type:complete len:114 (+) Transcript_71890:2419-2760(+)
MRKQSKNKLASTAAQQSTWDIADILRTRRRAVHLSSHPTAPVHAISLLQGCQQCPQSTASPRQIMTSGFNSAKSMLQPCAHSNDDEGRAGPEYCVPAAQPTHRIENDHVKVYK